MTWVASWGEDLAVVEAVEDGGGENAVLVEEAAPFAEQFGAGEDEG